MDIVIHGLLQLSASIKMQPKTYLHLMSVAGYSGTPLLKKLGIKPTDKLLVIHQPIDYPGWFDVDIKRHYMTKKDIPNIIHLFASSVEIFLSEMNAIKPFITKNQDISIWVSWYKNASGIATDITEDTIRNYALKNKLVDIKVCAVSDQWSGLKLVVPVKLRK